MLRLRLLFDLLVKGKFEILELNTGMEKDLPKIIVKSFVIGMKIGHLNCLMLMSIILFKISQRLELYQNTVLYYTVPLHL